MEARGQDPAAPAETTPTRSNEKLDMAIARTSGAPLRDGNRLDLLQNGPDTYDAWLAAIGRAGKWVHLDNYIFQDDSVGRRFADALKAKAEEGVTVRVLADWFGSWSTPKSFWREMRGAGVDVRPVNPPALGAPLQAIRRDHRKLVAVDGEYASTGGVCIDEGWLARDPETGLPYRDEAVSVRGPAVADLERAFAGVWDETGEPLPDEERPRVEDMPKVGDDDARVVIQEPSRMRILRVLELLTAGVQRRLWITDAYFLSMPILTQSLMAASRDGVDVRVLVPATSDLPAVGVLSRAGYRRFLEAGVRIFEYGGPMIHAKTLVADGWWSKAGSTNLNVSSLAANWEIDLVAEDTGFAQKMEQVFEEDLEHAREIRLVRTNRGSEIRTTHPVGKTDRRARRGPVGSGSGAAASVTRLGSAAFQQGGAPLRTQEHAIAVAASAALLGASLVGVRYPRLVAYPLTALGGAVGGLGLLNAAKRRLSG